MAFHYFIRAACEVHFDAVDADLSDIDFKREEEELSSSHINPTLMVTVLAVA